ncbi:MAG: hypothetical protein RIK87_07335 [Fuerstiella sp.]
MFVPDEGRPVVEYVGILSLLPLTGNQQSTPGPKNQLRQTTW